MTTSSPETALVSMDEYNNLGQALDWAMDVIGRTDHKNGDLTLAMRAASSHYRDSLLLQEEPDSHFTVDPEAPWPRCLTADHTD